MNKSIKGNIKKDGGNFTGYIVSLILVVVMLVGCGAKAGSGATEVATEAVRSGAINLTENDVGEVETEEKTIEEDPPALAYKTSEERQNQGRPVYEEGYNPRKYTITSNKFLMIEDVITELDEGYPEGFEYVQSTEPMGYMKLKGTLYELYFYDEPEGDLVYFPGDELPEGYEVKVTEDYEVVVADLPEIGGDHEFMVLPDAYLANQEANTISYKHYIGGYYGDTDIDPSIPLSESRWLYPALKSGMYGELIYMDGRYTSLEHFTFYQYLTKEDLANLPEDVTLADNVVHY